MTRASRAIGVGVGLVRGGRRGWPGDVVLDELSGTGLPTPFVIRTAKVAAIEARDATRLSGIGDGVRAEVLGRLRGHLGIDPAR
ncbi:hypothetical protein [Thiococcus pfennigii]|uniref:hypothetical protein n=1 Tax=Thiococcus pfennigii TaxID=1057 RepID=UPI0019087ADA|nr:hypothetical protein [Thiococcus pfennigii]